MRPNCGLAGVPLSFQKCSSFSSKGTLRLERGKIISCCSCRLVVSLLAAHPCDPTLAETQRHAWLNCTGIKHEPSSLW